MPLPNRNVLNAILDLYLKHRDKDRKSVNLSDRVIAGSTALFKRAFGQADDAQIIEFCQDIKKQFLPKDSHDTHYDPNKQLSFEEWMEIVYYLGGKAKEAQDNKIRILDTLGMTEKESLLTETLHGLRNYIIYKIKSENDEMHEKFNHFIQRQKEKDNADKAKIAHNRYIHTNVVEMVNDRKKQLLHLAYLEDPESISDSIDFHYFDYLLHLNEKVENGAYCLQKNFIKELYSKVFQKDTRISFEEFEESALRDSVEEKAKIEEKEKVSEDKPEELTAKQKIKEFEKKSAEDSGAENTDDIPKHKVKRK